MYTAGIADHSFSSSPFQAIPYFYGKGRGLASSPTAGSGSATAAAASNATAAFWANYDQRRPLCFDEDKQKIIYERKCRETREEEEEEEKSGKKRGKTTTDC